jgi:hypothetical protein
MTEQNIPQNQDEEQQNAQAIEGEEISPEDLEDVSGGSNTNCNFICADA